MEYIGVISFIHSMESLKHISHTLKNFQSQNYPYKKLFLISTLNLELNSRYSSSIPYIVFTPDSNYISLIIEKYSIDTIFFFHEKSFYHPNFISSILQKNIQSPFLYQKETFLFCLENYHFYSLKNYFCNLIFFRIKTFLHKKNISISSFSTENFFPISQKPPLYDQPVFFSNFNGRLFDFIFDKIYVIHLEKDILKKEIFLQNNNHTSLSFSFFKGTYGKESKECKTLFEKYKKQKIGYKDSCLYEKKLKKKMITSIGQIGYLSSMLNIFTDAIENKYKKIIILDDDVIFHQKFNLCFLRVLQETKFFHLLRLGCTHYSYKKYWKIKQKKLFFPTPNVDGSFSICYDHSIFPLIKKEILTFSSPFDSGYLRDLKIKNKYIIDYTCSNNLVIPDIYHSDILVGRDLKKHAQRVGWNLNDFWFINSLRKIHIYSKDPNIKISQSYTNFKIITDKKDSNEFLVDYNESDFKDFRFLEKKINLLLRSP